jgi:hypothetical protein
MSSDDKIDKKNVRERQVVGFFRQSLILFRKNGLLFMRNVSGTICEILVALFFLFILVILRYFVDNSFYNDQDSASNMLIPVTAAINTTSNRANIYYYPNNAYIQSIVNNAYQVIQASSPTFTATSNFQLFLKLIFIWMKKHSTETLIRPNSCRFKLL